MPQVVVNSTKASAKGADGEREKGGQSAQRISNLSAHISAGRQKSFKSRAVQ